MKLQEAVGPALPRTPADSSHAQARRAALWSGIGCRQKSHNACASRSKWLQILRRICVVTAFVALCKTEDARFQIATGCRQSFRLKAV